MNRFALALAGVLASPLAFGKECPAAPVHSSGQAVCFATAYAKKNGLPHGPSLKKTATKGRAGWTVSFADTRPDARSKGWQVDVDAATGAVTRFASYKNPER